MLIGIHTSVSKGYVHALDYAESVGAECIQFFAKSPRQWRASPIDPAAVATLITQRTARNFGPVFTHTAYLINLGTDQAELREKSIAALAEEIVRGGVLGVNGVVTHTGNDPLGDGAAAAKRIGSAICEAYERAADAGAGVRLLLENTAGSGRTYGSSFEELGAIIGASGMASEQLGVCFDTCHGFAAGMALDAAEGWERLVAELGSACGVERLGLVHANDCMFERGSHRDRHAWIGDGHIGRAGFAAMVCRPEFASVPVCMEMPGEVPEKDAVNIERLKTLRSACSQ